MARVQVIKQTTLNTNPQPTDWTLWFQWCRYFYDGGTMEHGYRFIWKRPQSEGGSLQAARGQARIPSVTVLEQLVAQARASGWGDYNADDFAEPAAPAKFSSGPPDASDDRAPDPQFDGSVTAWVDKASYGKDGLSVLVLGESSYNGNRGAPLPRDWNEGIIRSFLETPFLTVRRMVDVFYDTPPDREEYRKFWQRTAFANFIQTDMGKPGMRKTDGDWSGGQSAFQHYLRELRPQFVLVVGFELYDNLPNQHRQVHNFATEPPSSGKTGEKRPCLIYPNGHGYTFVCAILHTSVRSFKPEIWRRWVKASIEEAVKFDQSR